MTCGFIITYMVILLGLPHDDWCKTQNAILALLHVYHFFPTCLTRFRDDKCSDPLRIESIG